MKTITVEAKTNIPVQKVWEYWTLPEHITQWNFASSDWHCPRAENDLRAGGKFNWRMEAKDGSMGFDYSGTYLRVEIPGFLEMQLDDGRLVQVILEQKQGQTRIAQTFQPDDNDPEIQRQGWQAIMDNFKRHVEHA